VYIGPKIVLILFSFAVVMGRSFVEVPSSWMRDAVVLSTATHDGSTAAVDWRLINLRSTPDCHWLNDEHDLARHRRRKLLA
jgi:hypothetical protein